ncbi:MAG TPA: radical SAM protein [Firmicutes bacterium]|nr:radical SAM protein [Bacillota bacterium]
MSNRLDELILHVTNRCNLRCKHCWVDAGGGRLEELETSDWREIVRKGSELGVRAVKVTGGEPLIRNDVPDLLGYIRECGMTPVLETNGSLVTDDIACKIAKAQPLVVAVSLDSPDPEFHDWFRQSPGAHAAALRGVRALLSAGVSVQIVCSLCQQNVSAWREMVEMADALGVNSIKLNPVMPFGRAMLQDGIQLLSVENIISLHKEVVKYVKYAQIKVGVSYPIPLAFRGLDALRRAQPECNICHRLGVLCDGKLSICGIGQTTPGLVLGQWGRTELEEATAVLPSDEDLMRSLTGVCALCIHRKLCLGFCRALAFAVSGNLGAPYFVCQEAYRLGFFPTNRLAQGRAAAGDEAGPGNFR